MPLTLRVSVFLCSILVAPPPAFAQVSTLNVSDVTLVEGDAPGTTTFTFAVTLTAPAGPGGVTFDIATADGTAQDDNPTLEDNDYVAQSLAGQSISAGSIGPYTFIVTVNRDVTVEPNETFFVNVTNVTGATLGDGQGLGTITNDDVSITPIHDIQGPGASSPIVGSVATIRGIVTGVKSNGFFVQEEDAEVDADPATSEGIFVVTSGAPPAAAVVGALVQVTGTISEFVPASDPLDPPSTQLTFPTVAQMATGQPLPAAIPLTPTFPDPAGPFDQLERLEHMRVSVPSITVTGPSQGDVNEIAATGSTNGRFFGVLTGVARPFREAGIQAPDPAPSGSIPPIPRWDFNPERIRIESAALTGQSALTVRTGDVLTGQIVGPLEYASRSYGINPDNTGLIVVTPSTLTTTVSIGAANEITVASVNLRRLFDAIDDPLVAEPVLTAGAYDRRLTKASVAIRDHLRNPDIIGVQEVENLAALNDLAGRILSQGGPTYQAHLIEGNDSAGLDVGILVKTELVAGGVPRVSVLGVTQVGGATTWIDPADGSLALLNDRPPLVLEATINRTSTAGIPIVVIVNDLFGLAGINLEAPSGLTTVGDRVRRKRQAQAEFLANYVQQRLVADPGEPLVVVGSFHAFERNDGFVDVMNVVAGTPPADNQTVVPGDGVDLVNPDLVNLVNTAAPVERYSAVLDGHAANLDHVLVGPGSIAMTTARRIEYARIAADYSEVEFDGTSALRFSNRDPIVAYFAADALNVAGLSVTNVDTPDPVAVGQNLTYTITVTNGGPDVAELVTLSDPLPAGTTFVSLSSPGGWSCATPPVGAGGTITCTIPTLAVGSAVFTLTVAVAPATPAGTLLTNTGTVSSATSDPASGDESATATTTVTTSADLSITVVDAPDPVTAGHNLTYSITVTNSGPSSDPAVILTNSLPATMTFVGLSAPAGWVCTTPAVGVSGTILCTFPVLGPGTFVFTLTAAVTPTVFSGTALTNTATVIAGGNDPVQANNTASATTTVTTSADVSITKSGPATVFPGGSIEYTLTVFNAGPSAASEVSLADATPAGLTFVSAAGACVSVSPCALGTLAPGESRVVRATFSVPPAYGGANPIVNTATVSTSAADPVSTNNAAIANTLVGDTGPRCDLDGDGSPEFVTSPGAGGGPHLRMWRIAGGSVTETAGAGFFAYDPAFPGGVTIACRDVTGDGIGEIITGAGPGGGPHVRVWSVAAGSVAELTGFFAYDPAFPGGVTLGAGDVTGDGVGEIITGAGPGGGPHVRVWSVGGGTVSELTGFFAYDPAFPGGVTVAVGDVTGDGIGEVITGAGAGGGPHVRVWSVAGGSVSELTGFFAYDPAFPGGVTVATADLTGDGVAELITGAGPGGGPHVRVWSIAGGSVSEVAGFFAYDPAFPGGVSVSAGDVTGDGVAELITGAGPGGGPHVRVWSLTATGFVEVTGFFAYDPAFPGGVRVGR